MRRRLEVAENVVQEVVRVAVAGVAATFVFSLVVARGCAMSLVCVVRLPVVEDYDLVDAEDGGGASDLRGEGGLLVVCLAALLAT